MFLLGCGRQSNSYNPATQICCSGVISDRDNNTFCCGSTPYSLNTHICCDGALQARDGDTNCCGNVSYNRYAQN